MDNYFADKNDLNQRYVSLNQDAQVFNETQGIYPIDWILKLLKSKGQPSMAEKGLKSRTHRFIVKTLSES